MSNVLRLDDYREKIAQEKPIKEVKKVSIDDGYTAIPNELLESILKSGVLGWKGSYLLATVLKTLKWHKKSDWFSHSQVCEMMGIEANKYHINQLSAARSELIKAKILFEKGRNTGVNLAVFEWSMIIPDKVGKSRKSRDLIPENLGNTYPENVGNTKETFTKEKINITPLPPKGESANADGVPVVENKKQRSLNIDYVGIGKAYNECVMESGKNLPMLADPENLSQERKRKIKKLADVMKKRFGSCDAETFRNYFLDFMRSARQFYFGENDRGWRADFEYILREKVMDKTIEGSL
ncbi:replication protein [Pasteurella multocida]|uniref:replication protein n=1 Tax=Pasteurella multocida TaxID=747 RepID=UPI0032F9A40A|nr:replication protein [Pasteurella multocida]